MPARFLDTNVLIRYFTRDDEAKAEAAFALLTLVEQGAERLITSPLVIFETVYTLQRTYKVSRERIRQLILPVIELRGLGLPNKHLYDEALALYSRTSLSFADAFNVIYMQWQGSAEIYTWDTDFDKMPGITRLEPTR